MKEKFTSSRNPSEILTSTSYAAEHRGLPDQAHGKLDFEQSKKAAYAAKEFMNVAVDVYDAVEFANKAAGLESGHVSDITESVAGFQGLIDYAERRSLLGAKGIETKIGVNENAALDAFKADAEIRRIGAKVDMFEAMDPDAIGKASDEAYARRKLATAPTDRSHWLFLENKLARYQEYLEGDETNTEFNVSTKRAGEMLKKARGGAVKDQYEVAGTSMNDVRDDTKMLREQAEMLNFLAELYPANADDSADVKPEPSSHTQYDTKPSTQPTNPERLMTPEQKVLHDVLASAKNNTFIHTDAPKGVDLRVGNASQDMTGKGFSSFGSRQDVRNGAHEGIFRTSTGIPERVQFQTASMQPKYDEGVTRNWRGKEEPYKRLIGQEEVPLPHVINPTTGQQEPGVVFRYGFSSQLADGYPRDQTPYATNSGRPGNLLNVETTLPKSVADQLEKMIRDNPASVREVVHQLVIAEGGVPEDAWNGTRLGGQGDDRPVAAMSPPYDKLFGDQTIALYGNQALINGEYTSLTV